MYTKVSRKKCYEIFVRVPTFKTTGFGFKPFPEIRKKLHNY